jgi:hypothetical protein
MRKLQRRPQYRLAMLFALVTVISVPLAVWTSREHEYRLRLAAVKELKRCGSIGVQTDDPKFGSCRALGDNAVLQRDDVVVFISCAFPSDSMTAAIKCFPTLKFLRLSTYGATDERTRITDQQLREIGKLPLVEELSLHGMSIAEHGVRHLAGLRSLRVLNLSRTKISGAGFEKFSSLQHLEELDLHATDVTDEGVRYLAALRSVRILNLIDTKITDAALMYLSAMESLECLYLDDNDITNESLVHLAKLRKLRRLGLGGTKVSDAGLKIIQRFGSLESVGFNHCAISDAGIMELGRVASLREVHMYFGTCVTAAGVAQLKRLNPALHVGWGKAKDPTPKELAKLMAKWAAWERDTRAAAKAAKEDEKKKRRGS